MDSKSRYPRFPRVSFGQAVAIGLSAGFIGAAGMTVSNWLEQLITHRPASYVPGKTFAYHMGLNFHDHPDFYNHMHHFGMGILTAPIRAAMSYYGVIGPVASFFFTSVRLLADQVVENAAGTSAPPWTWPINEQVIDVTHKFVYALITGYLCDRYVRGVDWFNG